MALHNTHGMDWMLLFVRCFKARGRDTAEKLLNRHLKARRSFVNQPSYSHYPLVDTVLCTHCFVSAFHTAIPHKRRGWLVSLWMKPHPSLLSRKKKKRVRCRWPGYDGTVWVESLRGYDQFLHICFLLYFLSHKPYLHFRLSVLSFEICDRLPRPPLLLFPPVLFTTTFVPNGNSGDHRAEETGYLSAPS